jgi:hypothetical protein
VLHGCSNSAGFFEGVHSSLGEGGEFISNQSFEPLSVPSTRDFIWTGVVN